MTLPYQRKCEICGEYFQPETGSAKTCQFCKDRKTKTLRRNNPKGYNKYKKSEIVKPKNPYELMTDLERAELAKDLYQASRKFYALYKSALARWQHLSRPSSCDKDYSKLDNKELIELAKGI